MYEIPSLEDAITSNKSNSEIICQNDAHANSIKCDDALECANEKSLDTRDKLAPACCSATYRCNNVTIITNDIDFSEWHFDVAIRCDGYKSCDDTISIIRATNAGDIYLSAAIFTILKNSNSNMTVDCCFQGDNNSSDPENDDYESKNNVRQDVRGDDGDHGTNI